MVTRPVEILQKRLIYLEWAIGNGYALQSSKDRAEAECREIRYALEQLAKYPAPDAGEDTVSAIDAIKQIRKAYGLEKEEDKKKSKEWGCCLGIMVAAAIFLAGIVYIIRGIIALIQSLF